MQATPNGTLKVAIVGAGYVASHHLAALKRLDFVEVHRKGSHVKMKHADGRIIVFPLHDEVDRYTLKGA